MISTSSLSIGHADHILLSEINVQLIAGKLTCLIGANGSGKSTLIRTILGNISPIAGEVHLNSRPVQSYSDTNRSHLISQVFTETHIDEFLKVRDLVSLGRFPYTNWFGNLSKDDISMIDKAMELADILPLSNKIYRQLSDGEKQRVMIARALAQDTPIMVLDEPTSHLDVEHRVALLLLLRNLAHKENKAILLTTHDIEMSIKLADQMWLINNKKQLLVGRPEELALRHAFNTLFDHEAVEFNLKTGAFEFEVSNHTAVQILGGNDLDRFWLGSSLKKEGYKLVNTPNALSVTIENGIDHKYRLCGLNIKIMCNSLDMLIEELNRASGFNK